MPALPIDHDTETHPHICGACTSTLVQPVACDQLSSRYWQVTLRCPECESEATVALDDETLDRLETVLTDAQDSLVCDLAALTDADAELFLPAHF
jgi:hypothetical protein